MQNFQKFCKIFETFCKFCKNSAKFCKICLREGEFLVDLEKCEKMHIWTRKSALIQPRTSLGKSDVSWPQRIHNCLHHSTSRSHQSTSLFPKLVLGWINADFRVQIRIFQHFSRPPRQSPSRQQIWQIFGTENFYKMCKIFEKHFAKKLQILLARR